MYHLGTLYVLPIKVGPTLAFRRPESHPLHPSTDSSVSIAPLCDYSPWALEDPGEMGFSYFCLPSSPSNASGRSEIGAHELEGWKGSEVNFQEIILDMLGQSGLLLSHRIGTFLGLLPSGACFWLCANRSRVTTCTNLK